MYKLYTDKKEIFECEISLDGASLNDSVARLVVETPQLSLMFNGDISQTGKCTIPVKKLRGLLDESVSGKMKLEVIAEDTYFSPWESDFTVETSKRVTVEVKSQSKPIVSSKPKMKVNVIKEKLDEEIVIIDDTPITISERQHIVNIMKLLIKEDINIKNLKVKRNKLNNIIASYQKTNPILKNKKAKVLEGVVKVLAKRK
jgi:hypothetical protein|tara:strand:- start:477 stop:1079 length:603 start_codon:yes stop_codon:yes gene_type:complete